MRKRHELDWPGKRHFRVCAVIPTYNNPLTIEAVVRRCLPFVERVFVVDDGGDAESQAALAAVGVLRNVEVLRRERNGGKGAAVRDGLRAADRSGFTHALQVDADGQHAIEDAALLIDASGRDENTLVLAAPRFDESAPLHRRVLRKLSNFWVDLSTILDGGRIEDPMCGFRVYPVAVAADVANKCGSRMDFDPEIATRLVWEGVAVRNIPTDVRYLSKAEGGVSHFRAVHDNVLLSLLYSRLVMLRFLGLRKFL